MTRGISTGDAFGSTELASVLVAVLVISEDQLELPSSTLILAPARLEVAQVGDEVCEVFGGAVHARCRWYGS